MNYKIDPNKYYSAAEVVRMGVLPWKSYITFNRRLNEQKWIEIFNPIVEQKKLMRYYHIKGENILKFVELAESGKLTI